MYTIEEPFINTPEAIEGNVPFFLVKDENGSVVYSDVTRQECVEWIEKQ
tara:strand:- start:294 stop:440 length:147 start_codon:yes stop_codon:yes gene_type:complete